MKNFMFLSAMVALGACSGSSGASNSGNTRGATGEISRACLAADRSAASVSLCTCIQGVANAELSSNDRTRVARFFANPELANDTKISTRDSDDAFWDRYRDFYGRARRQCG